MKSDNNIDHFFKEKLENRAFELEDAFIADLEAKLDQKGKVGFFWWKFLLGFFLVGSLFFMGFYYLNQENLNVSNQLKYSNEVLLEPLKNKKNSLINEQKENTDKVKKEVGERKERVSETENKRLKVLSDINKKTSKKKSTTINIDEESTSNLSRFQSKKQHHKLALNKNDLTVKKNKEPLVGANFNKTNITPIFQLGVDTGLVFKTENGNINKLDDFEKDKLTVKLKEADKEKMNSLGFVKELNAHTKAKNTTLINDSNIVGAKKLNGSDNIKETNTIVEAKKVGNKNIISSKPLNDELKKEAEYLNSNIKAETTVGFNNNNSTVTNLEKESVDSNQIIKNDSVDDPSKKDFVEVDLEKSEGVIDFKKWNLSVFASPAIISKKISGNESDIYYTKREAGESNISTLNYGVEVGYFFNKNINLSIGINSLTYGEDAKYTVENIKTTTERIVSSYDTILNFVYDSTILFIDTTIFPVDTIYDIDTTSTVSTSPNYFNKTTNDTTNKDDSNKNRYTYIHIPFMFGYKIPLNKFGINVKGGIIYGRLVKVSGRYINPEGTAVVPIKLKQNIFNIVVSTALSYRIKKIDLYLEPRYQFNINNVFPNADTNQKYKVLSVNFGIGLAF